MRISDPKVNPRPSELILDWQEGPYLAMSVVIRSSGIKSGF